MLVVGSFCSLRGVFWCFFVGCVVMLVWCLLVRCVMCVDCRCVLCLVDGVLFVRLLIVVRCLLLALFVVCWLLIGDRVCCRLLGVCCLLIVVC